MARKRLAERIAAGTAEIVLGDAAAMPWEGGRFSVVTSLDAMKFLPDPQGASREMHRVLHPGGRAVITMGDDAKMLVGSTDRSGARDAWGMWHWTDADAQRLMERAGFSDVAVSVLPVFSKSQLVRGTRPASSGVEGAPETAVPVEEGVALPRSRPGTTARRPMLRSAVRAGCTSRSRGPREARSSPVLK